MDVVSGLLCPDLDGPASFAGELAWPALVAKARGQTVYWNAWGGDDPINRYIQWAARSVQKEFGVEVRHVKLADTAEAVTRVLAEKAAGKVTRGSVDLLWINGQNFAAMKEHGLLHGPFTQMLPNFQLVDTTTKPTSNDFTVPVDGLEAPWSMAQFVFIYDTARVTDAPRDRPTARMGQSASGTIHVSAAARLSGHDIP